MKKTIVTVSLLLFVGVSILVAMADVSGWRQNSTNPNDDASAGQVTPAAIADSETVRFTAVYFHAPHRCPTCTKIETLAHEALNSDIEEGNIVWQVADYTANENKSLVEKCEVLASTVVLLEKKDGKVVRWENLDGVWDHTDDAQAFETFIDESWDKFKIASAP